MGILGLGHIGTDYARMAKGLGAKQLLYHSRSQHEWAEAELGLKLVDLAELFKQSDLVFVALPVGAGDALVTRQHLESLRPGSLLVSIADPKLFDLDALYDLLAAGKLRAAFDENIKEDRFTSLPLNTWFTPNESTAYNTAKAIEAVSQSAVNTILNLLRTGNDQYLMNPNYKKDSETL